MLNVSLTLLRKSIPETYSTFSIGMLCDLIVSPAKGLISPVGWKPVFIQNGLRGCEACGIPRNDV